MAEDLHLPATTERADIHAALLPQVKALLTDETDAIAAMANLSAAIKQAYDPLWVGFYRVEGDTLILGPFQGPVACTRITKGKGVCGTAWAEGRTVIVPDVDAFPGHIACSSEARSEVVIPVRNARGTIIAVLDVDSTVLNDFDTADARRLEELVTLIQHVW